MHNVRERILSVYGDRHMRKSAIRHEDAGIFAQLLAGKGYRTILEIGTYRGCTSAELSQYCERVVTVDLLRGTTEIDEPSVSRQVLWDGLGIRNIDLVLVADNQEKKARVDALDFDFAFLDGAHDFESVKADFALVERCGRVLFHDYYAVDDGRNTRGVYDFVNTILHGKLEIFGIFVLWTST